MGTGQVAPMTQEATETLPSPVWKGDRLLIHLRLSLSIGQPFFFMSLQDDILPLKQSHLMEEIYEYSTPARKILA